MFLSPNQLQDMALHLEEQSGDPRYGLEGFKERIVTSIEALANMNKPVTGDFEQRLVNAVNVLEMPEESVFGEATFNSAGVYYPENYGYDGFNFVNVDVHAEPIVMNKNGETLRRAFNYPVTINNGITSCENLFAGLTNFNREVSIPPSVIRTTNMFANCQNYNQPITFQSYLKWCGHMFDNCVNFAVDNFCINTGPDSVSEVSSCDCGYMFANVKSVSNIEIYGAVTNASNFYSMFRGVNGTINIFTNAHHTGYSSTSTLFNSIIRYTSSSSYMYLMGVNMTWTKIDNRHYVSTGTGVNNTQYTVHLYDIL